jgi:uncharacterized membrane protein
MIGMRRYLLISLGLVAAAFAASALCYSRLPERIPIHWNIHGEVDRFGDRWTVFLMPCFMLLMMGVIALLPWASLRTEDIDVNRPVYGRLMVILVALFAFIQAIILYGAFGGDSSSRLLIAGLCVFFGLIANLLGKIDRNCLIGVRTPWTIASERVWIETHRLAAWLGVAAAAIGFVLALLPFAPPWIAFIVVMAGFLYPVVHSFIAFRKYARQGAL